MSLTYTTWKSQLANLLVEDENNTNFTTFLPGCIDYAEQRLYRELDLISTRVIDSTANFTIQNQLFTLPSASGTFVVVEQINAIDGNGSRTSLIPITKEFINASWPSYTVGTGVPQYFAPVNNTTYLIAPAPDQTYQAEVVGTVRPTPLSSSNTTTFLTTNLPDLFMAASMVFGTSYQRDFGAGTDDPSRSASWEGQYQKLLGSANLEELRKRFMGPAWQAMTPSPVATPPRV